ncbi:metallophosphoesterase [Mesorhizobium amorphae]|uniref:metallophosphoesterase n=1 Tax=Mesorhizobium amorphae TaxID=71433 RepID=UPI001183C3E0|nr:metallophosphoesterase [Mesorhizobium amorphae]
MKIWILSDLHLEYAQLRHSLAIPDAEVCVVAGDLCRGIANGVDWLASHVADAMPCVYVAGNHEFYKGSIREGMKDGRAAASAFPRIHFLENEVTVIHGIRFIGATLWTDYRIERNPPLAMAYARERMNDHRQIALQRDPWQRFRPQDAFRLHQKSRGFIETALTADDTPRVVVTHHLPHPRSVPEEFDGDLLNAAYASDLSAVIERGRPSLWVHGHTHHSCDYRVFDTRVVCNPRGYDDENKSFDRSLVVSV